MKFIEVVLIVIWASLVATVASAEADPESIVEAYFETLVEGKSSDSFDALMAHSQLDELKPREIALVKGQIDQGMTLYGRPSGFESISKNTFGSSIVRLVYITKHEYLPLVWNFYFYRTGGAWQLLNFDFNDQFKNLE